MTCRTKTIVNGGMLSNENESSALHPKIFQGSQDGEIYLSLHLNSETDSLGYPSRIKRWTGFLSVQICNKWEEVLCFAPTFIMWLGYSLSTDYIHGMWVTTDSQLLPGKTDIRERMDRYRRQATVSQAQRWRHLSKTGSQINMEGRRWFMKDELAPRSLRHPWLSHGLIHGPGINAGMQKGPALISIQLQNTSYISSATGLVPPA